MRTILTLALGFMFAGCGDSGNGFDFGVSDLSVSAPVQTDSAATVTPTSTASVSVQDNFFTPQAVTIAVGGTVTWTWMGANAHTVNSNSGAELDSGPAKTTGTYSHRFATAGTFPYHCLVHGLIMSGTVTVQ